MLEELTIRDLGTIESAVLEPGPGFTVLTGETGAGKTMVLSGLGLLFGARADSALVRTGAGRASVDGRLRPPVGSPALQRLLAAGAELDDGTLLVSRTVSADGRSRCMAGGRPVPVAVLGELGTELLAVHGQSGELRLRRPGEQRAVLDRFAGPAVGTPLAGYRDAYRRWRAAGAALAELAGAERARALEADELRHGLARIAALGPRPGEEDELAARIDRLGHAEVLRAAAREGLLRLTGQADGEPAGGPGMSPGDWPADAVGAVGTAVRALSGVAGHDAWLGGLADRLAAAAIQLTDAASELAGYLAALEAGPDADAGALAALQERRAALGELTRRYGADCAEVLAWADAAAGRLADLDGTGERADELTRVEAAARAEVASLGTELSRVRTAAARRFAARVSRELRALALPAAAVGVRVERSDEPGPEGFDEVEVTFAAHREAPDRPLARAASGGELARVMLAVEAVLAGADPVPAMVFDEVDAGVGGAAAVEVGRRLGRLAGDHQVLAVTHLAQVAAFADRHLRVVADGARTRVDELDGEDRIAELARMLGGLAGSAAARTHAAELRALAGGAPAGALR